MLDKELAAIQFDPLILKNAIEDANLTQAEFNRMLGYRHVNTVNKIIKNKRAASATDLLRFSIALNKDPKEFCKII